MVTKRLVAWSAVGTGAAALGRRRHGPRLRILMYHGVVPRRQGPTALGDLFISVEQFREHMRHLAKHFRVISLDDLVAGLEQGTPLPDRAALITFDDGYRNTLDHALPMLRALNLPATVFVSSQLVGGNTPLWFDTLRVMRLDHGETAPDRFDAYRADVERIRSLPWAEQEAAIQRVAALAREHHILERYPELALAGWEEWRSAVAEGLMTIGSHSLRHDDLTAMTSADRLEDLAASKRRIEQELNRPCRAMAYPYGRWDAAVARAALDAGYACALTTEAGLNTVETDPFALRRTLVGDEGDTMIFRACVAGLWESWRDVARR